MGSQAHTPNLQAHTHTHTHTYTHIHTHTHTDASPNDAAAAGVDPVRYQGRAPRRTYHDAAQGILGCKHYKRRTQLVAPCCNQVFTCRCVCVCGWVGVHVCARVFGWVLMVWRCVQAHVVYKLVEGLCMRACTLTDARGSGMHN